MAVVSKEIFEEMKNETCSVFHPWHQNCVMGNLMIMLSAAKGSALFFGALYMVQYIPKYKQLSREDVIPIIKKMSASVSAAVAYTVLFTSGNCFFRNICGHFTYNIVAYLVPILPGLSVFLEYSNRKTMMMSAFSSMAIEGLLRRIYNSGFIKRNLYAETILFMFCNGLLMYTLKNKDTITKADYAELWFYLPRDRKSEKNLESHQPCSHYDSCALHCLKEILKYSSLAFCLSIFKTIWTNVKLTKSFRKILEQIIMVKNLKLCIFIGAYVGIYKLINCFLCRKNGKDSELFALLGGIAAGVPYYWLPSFTLLSSLIIVILRIMGRKLQNKYQFPDLPYEEIIFIISNAFLFNTRIFNSDACPPFFIKVIEACTYGRASDIYSSFQAKIPQ